MSDDHAPTGESAAATAMTVGCVVLVLLLVLGGGLSWFTLSRARVTERAMMLDAAMARMAAMELPGCVNSATSPELQRVHEAVERGELESQAAVIFIASVTNSPEFVAGALFRIAGELWAVEGLTDAERTEAAAVVARFAGGVIQRTVEVQLGLEIVRAAPIPGEAEAFRIWLTDIRDRCAALGLEEPARRVEIRAVVSQAVDELLMR